VCAEGGATVERGLAYWDEGQNQRAIEDFTTAITLNPDERASYVNRASAYFFDLKDYDRALADLNIALKLNPKDAYSYSLRVDIWEQKQDYQRAIEDSNAASSSPKESINYERRARDERKLALWGWLH